MKKLNCINLHKLGQAELAKREEKLLKGGYDLPCVCVIACPCAYAGAQEGPDDDFWGGASREEGFEYKKPADLGFSLTDSSN